MTVAEFDDPDPTWTYRLFRWLVFRVGHTRWLGWHHFPFLVTWSVDKHAIDLDEVLREALPRAQAGDVFLHRDRGFLSNLAIGGAMVHAGLYLGDGRVVEAISDGVVRRHAAYILHSDYAMILRPRLGEGSEREQAVRDALAWAERIVGFPYDPLFRFNCKPQRALVEELGAEKAVKKRVRFCCTKVPLFCYFDHAEKLNLRRRRATSFLHRLLSWIGIHPGRTVVDADMYVLGEFDLVWASRRTTPEWARRMKRKKEYVDKLAAWWDGETARAGGGAASAGGDSGSRT